MNQMIEHERIRSGGVLQALAEKCRQDLKRRYPKIDFDAEVWAFSKLHGTNMLDVKFSRTIEDFADKDPSYVLTCRCLIARKALEGKTKTWKLASRAWRLLNRQTVPLFAMCRHHLVELEEERVLQAPG